MQVTITYDNIVSLVKEEISKEASLAHSADGVSLYDKLKLTSRDDEKIIRLTLDAMSYIQDQCGRFISSAEFGDAIVVTIEASTRRINGKESSVEHMLKSVVVNAIMRKYLLYKNETDLATKYETFITEEISNLKRTLFTKHPPIY